MQNLLIFACSDIGHILVTINASAVNKGEPFNRGCKSKVFAVKLNEEFKLKLLVF